MDATTAMDLYTQASALQQRRPLTILRALELAISRAVRARHRPLSLSLLPELEIMRDLGLHRGIVGDYLREWSEDLAGKADDESGIDLSLSEIAHRLGMGASQIRVLIDHFGLPVVRAGRGRYVVPRAEFEAWLEGLESRAGRNVRT